MHTLVYAMDQARVRGHICSEETVNGQEWVKSVLGIEGVYPGKDLSKGRFKPGMKSERVMDYENGEYVHEN